MSLLRQIVRAKTVEEPFTNMAGPRVGWSNRAGIKVTRDRAMRLSTVWACIRLRAETIGMLPIDVVEYDNGSRIRQDLPPWLQRPNPEMTRFELFERTSASLDTDGNAFWWYQRDRLDRVAEVWPLPPTSVEVFRDQPRRPGDPPGPKRFRVGNEELGSDEILHIPGFSLPGRLRGLNPIEEHAHAIGLAAAAEEFGESFFGNGSVMAGVLVADRDPGEKNVRRMQDSFARDHRGLRNAHKPGFLFGGVRWEQLTIPNDQAQFLETRKFQAEEIARIFRVPAHKVNILDHATFSNIEHQSIEWVQDGVMPYTSRIEAAVLAAGLLDVGQQLRFNLDGLMRGDTMSRYAAYAIARQWGWLNVDDIRALEDLNPLPDGQGQTYLEPLNMVPAGSARPTDDTVAKAMLEAGIRPEVIAAVTGVRYVVQEA